ncbi:hypothetical protein WR25_12750 [Diploscapter pachys]|uniref:Protein JTB n=1 Tax=Diploscapter pachys TaxID=2018661 RepID=A0A2A2JVS1_9BILA|nr:hypothetical protein WR25_12750 [Diploscapter pachys]
MDTITVKKIFTAVLALIGFSVMVFFIEEITEESEPNGTDIKSYISTDGKKLGPSSSSASLDDCWQREPVQIISECLPCKEFDIKAIKAKHCVPTGYFDRINCTKSGIMTVRPCYNTKALRNKSSFYTFFLINFILSIAFYIAVSSRKAHLEQYAYMRVNQHFEP